MFGHVPHATRTLIQYTTNADTALTPKTADARSVCQNRVTDLSGGGKIITQVKKPTAAGTPKSKLLSATKPATKEAAINLRYRGAVRYQIDKYARRKAPK